MSLIADVNSLRVAGYICLDFVITNASIVQQIVEGFVRFKATDELAHFMAAAAGLPQMWHIKVLEEGWLSVVSMQSLDTFELSLRAVELILRCVCFFVASFMHKVTVPHED
jgi:hypothetical protein